MLKGGDEADYLLSVDRKAIGTVEALPPLAEQNRIIAEVERRLSILENLDAIVAVNMQLSGRIRDSVLQQAFAREV